MRERECEDEQRQVSPEPVKNGDKAEESGIIQKQFKVGMADDPEQSQAGLVSILQDERVFTTNLRLSSVST